MSRVVLMAAAALAAGQVAGAVPRVAVIDNKSHAPPTEGQIWCDFLQAEGFDCTLFPEDSPPTSLDGFRVVIDLSNEWADPEGLLADHLRKGWGVITWGDAPAALGPLWSNPTVSAWVGANYSSYGFGPLITTESDAVLGSTPVGTVIGFCGDEGCDALLDTSGHPNAKILARYEEPEAPIGVLRNTWNGGQSVYFSREIMPLDISPMDRDIVRRAVTALSQPIVPAVSDWGLVCLGLLLLTAGSVVHRGLGDHCGAPSTHNARLPLTKGRELTRLNR